MTTKPFNEVDLCLEFVFSEVSRGKDNSRVKWDHWLYSFIPNNLDSSILESKLDEIEKFYMNEVSKFNKDSDQTCYRKLKREELGRRFFIGISSKWNKEVIEEVIRCFMYYNIGFYQISICDNTLKETRLKR